MGIKREAEGKHTMDITDLQYGSCCPRLTFSDVIILLSICFSLTSGLLADLIPCESMIVLGLPIECKYLTWLPRYPLTISVEYVSTRWTLPLFLYFLDAS